MKPITEEAKRIIDEWWRGKNKEPVLMLSATEDYTSTYPINRSNRHFTSESEAETDMETFWFDYEVRIDSFLEGINHTYYSPHNYPCFEPRPFGPNGLAALVGAVR